MSFRHSCHCKHHCTQENDKTVSGRPTPHRSKSTPTPGQGSSVCALPARGKSLPGLNRMARSANAWKPWRPSWQSITERWDQFNTMSCLNAAQWPINKKHRHNANCSSRLLHKSMHSFDRPHQCEMGGTIMYACLFTASKTSKVQQMDIGTARKEKPVTFGLMRFHR